MSQYTRLIDRRTDRQNVDSNTVRMLRSRTVKIVKSLEKRPRVIVENTVTFIAHGVCQSVRSIDESDIARSRRPATDPAGRTESRVVDQQL